MTVREYLELIGKTNSADSLTFLIAKAVKMENAPAYEFYYKQTPILSIWDWVENNSAALDYYLISEAQPPIDCGSGWLNRYNRGDLKCFVVVPKEDWALMYSEKQGAEKLQWIDKGIKGRA